VPEGFIFFSAENSLDILVQGTDPMGVVFVESNGKIYKGPDIFPADDFF
jgi:hypothetical protein